MDVTAKSAMILDVKVFFLKSEKENAEKSSTAPIEMVYKSRFQLVTFAARLAIRDFWLEKCISVRCRLFPWCRILCNVSSSTIN